MYLSTTQYKYMQMNIKNQQNNIIMKENFIDRLLLFVDQHGGVYDVAEKIEISPQTFYSMKRRNSLPNLSLVYLLKEKFPALDTDWLLFGESGDKDSEEISELKKKLERFESIVDKLVGKTKGEVKSSGCTGEASAFITANGKRRFLLSPGLTHRMYTRF